MSVDLRPYQTAIYDRLRDRLRHGVRTVLVQAPTGSGKTVLIAKMCQTAESRGYRAWFIVHRRELVKQSLLTLTEAADLNVGVVSAGFPLNRHAPIQVCAIQSLRHRRKLLHAPDLIIFDEAHHLAARSWAAIHSAYPDAAVIGLTATPERLDGTGLGAWFEELIIGPSVAHLIADGWLASYRLFAPGGPDLSSVRITAGDYNKKDLNIAMNRSRVVGDVVAHYRQYAQDKRAVVFAWSVEASIETTARFNAAGIPASHIDGRTSEADRDAAVEAFRAGRIRVLSNVEIVSEGFDLPAIEAAILLRPTQSLGLYLQHVGRALRPAPGKREALILDHAGNCRTHGLPDDERSWTLEGQRRRHKDAACPVKQCSACFAVLRSGAASCKYCGFAFQVSPQTRVKEEEGALEEVDLAAERAARKREQRAAKSLEDLVALGRARGYGNPEGWARHVLAGRGQANYARRRLNRTKGEELKFAKRTYGELP